MSLTTDTDAISVLQLTDDDAMRAARLVPREVALLLLDAFSEMVFVHGRVHADPHPGNLLVRPLTDPRQGAHLRPSSARRQCSEDAHHATYGNTLCCEWTAGQLLYRLPLAP